MILSHCNGIHEITSAFFSLNFLFIGIQMSEAINIIYQFSCYFHLETGKIYPPISVFYYVKHISIIRYQGWVTKMGVEH